LVAIVAVKRSLPRRWLRLDRDGISQRSRCSGKT
jgi:hypothetical protein